MRLIKFLILNPLLMVILDISICHANIQYRDWKEYPWVVQVISTNIERTIEYRCTGSAIASNAVLTAAHCIKNKINVHIDIVNGRSFQPNYTVSNDAFPDIKNLYLGIFSESDTAVLIFHNSILDHKLISGIPPGAEKIDVSMIGLSNGKIIIQKNTFSEIWEDENEFWPWPRKFHFLSKNPKNIPSPGASGGPILSANEYLIGSLASGVSQAPIHSEINQIVLRKAIQQYDAKIPYVACHCQKVYVKENGLNFSLSKKVVSVGTFQNSTRGCAQLEHYGLPIDEFSSFKDEKRTYEKMGVKYYRYSQCSPL